MNGWFRLAELGRFDLKGCDNVGIIAADYGREENQETAVWPVQYQKTDFVICFYGNLFVFVICDFLFPFGEQNFF